MADNITLNAGSGGSTLATDDISGVQYQRVKITYGTDGTATDVSSSNPLPITISSLAVVGGGVEASALRVTLASDSTGLLSVDDNGGSLTVDNPALAVTGGGVEASALRVTIASDSTGVLSVDDNGSSITVDNDGTFAVQAAQSGTWNITNVSGTISLPTGAATAAKQPALGTAGTASSDVITVQGIASMTALKVDGSAVTQPVSGTVTANAGSGTFAVSAASLPLPSGASTSAKQPALGTAGTASSDVLTVQGIASMTALKVDGSAVTHPVAKVADTSASTTMQNAATATGNGTNATVDGYSTGLVEISGTFVATVAFEISNDGGTTWYSISGVLTGSNTIASTTTSTGMYRVSVAGAKLFRARISSYTSGSVTAKITVIADATAPKVVNLASGATVDVTSVVPGTGATSLGKAQDAVAGSTDTGVAMLAVRADAAAAMTPAAGDYSTLRTDKYGALKTTNLPDAVSVVKFAVIDNATSGDNTIVAAAGSGVKIRVLSVFLMSAGTTTVRFESGASGTALTGQMNCTAQSGFVLPFNPAGWFETATNTLLNLELSAAISVDGCLTYVEV